MSLNGIDIAYSQRGINAGAVPGDFVIVKGTQGTWLTISCCDEQYQSAKAAGKLMGIYHYAESGDVAAEAEYFLSECSGYIGEAMIVLDWEAADNPGVGNPAWAVAWCNYVYRKTGIKPVLYMSGSVARDLDWSAAVAGDYALWEAYYTQGSTGYVQGAPTFGGENWAEPCMLQYTSSGRLANWNDVLDLNEFYGDANAWRAYAGASSNPVQAPADQTRPAVQPTSCYVWTVANIQYWANICNYGAPTIDDIDGPETQSCVGNGQRAYGITADNLFGSQTQGFAEDQIRRYQQRLNELGFACTVDGIAGPETYQAVKSFQAARGLTADGIVGVQTFHAMWS